MKIIEVCPRYAPYIGGVETHVKELSERLRKKFNLEVYTTDSTGKLKKTEIIDGIKVSRFRSFAPKNSYYFSLDLLIALNKSNFDILHAHSYHALPLFISSLSKKTRTKFITTFHYYGCGYSTFRSFLHMPYTLLGYHIVNSADKIICVSENEKETIIKKFPCTNEKIIHIPNGVDCDRFANSESSFTENPFNLNMFNILYVGRLSTEKNLKILFFAYKELQKDFHNIKLTIVGEGPEYKKLQKLAKKLSITNIEWVSKVSQKDVVHYYKSADIFVLPSKKEIQGISILEAMAAGLPIITTKFSGVEEIVHPNTGLVFENNDYLDLANKISTLIEDDDLRKKIAKNAQKHVKKKFDWEVLMPKYIKLFEEIGENE